MSGAQATLRIGLVAITVTFVACRGGGNSGPTIPDPSLGPTTSVTLCGSTTELKSPCRDFPDNSIQIRVGAGSGLSCPCFNFAFLNQNLTDLGPATTTTYEFTGFRQGTYTVTGQFMTTSIYFEFSHNSSTSVIGVVPSSLQSVSGPAGGVAQSCQIAYFTSNPNRTPVAFSFQFAVAAAADGGSC